MKRSKKIIFNQIKKRHRVPEGTQFPGLNQLFQKAGLVDDKGEPTEEGRKAINEPG